MDWVKKVLLGFAFGFFYSFVSFYLLNPGSNFNFIYTITFGIIGMIYALFYRIFFGILCKLENSVSTQKHFIYSIISGAVSGLFASSLNVFFMVYPFINSNKTNVVISDNFKKMFIFDILQFSSGCILMGIMVGSIISYSHYCSVRNRERC